MFVPSKVAVDFDRAAEAGEGVTLHKVPYCNSRSTKSPAFPTSSNIVALPDPQQILAIETAAVGCRRVRAVPLLV